MYIPSFENVREAEKKISAHIHKTPVLCCEHLNRLSGAELFFKCENLQKTGVFKVRGACNAVLGLSRDKEKWGVVTHSSGNHAQALSYAAKRRGIAATVIMPHTAPKSKKAAVIEYGGKIIECEPGNLAREKMLAQVVADIGAEVVHPYNDHRVIAGQGTCGIELLEQCGYLDAVMAPIGGGGLVSGLCLAVSSLSPKTEIYAAEPVQADDACRSLQRGRIIENDQVQTIADGLMVNLKPLTWHFVSRYIDRILLADEQEIINAMYLVWQRMKLVIEPSSAVALAAILKHRELFKDKRVGIILSGGNVDFDNLPPLV